MKRSLLAPLSLASLAISVLFSALVPIAMGQANVQGQWSTLSYTMPINPIHAALLHNNKILIVAGSGNCPPTQAGCPSGPPYGPANESGAALLDLVAGTITPFSVTWDMFCNGMIVLPDGRAFIDGGTINYNPFSGSVQASIFDPGDQHLHQCAEHGARSLVSHSHDSARRPGHDFLRIRRKRRNH